MTNKQRFRARIANLQEKGFDIGVEAGIALERQRIAAKYPQLTDFLKECELRKPGSILKREISSFLEDLARQPWDI